MNATYLAFAEIAFSLMGSLMPEALALQIATKQLLQRDIPIKDIVAARAELESKLHAWECHHA